MKTHLEKLSVGVRPLIPVLVVGVLAAAAPAWAEGLSGIATKIQSFNTEIIAIGAALALTGFLRAALSILIGLGSAASAIVMLAVGIAISASPQIVGFFVTVAGA